MTAVTDELDAGVVKSLRLACACGTPPAMFLSVALTAAHPESVDAAIDFIIRHADALRILCREPGNLRTLAEVEPSLRFTPELGRVRADVGDHELRGKLLFRDLVGQRSFFQVAALAIGNVELDAQRAELLEHLGVNTQLLDVGIWPLTVARRVALSSSDWAHGTLAGLATLLNPKMAMAPVGAFMSWLDAVERGVESGRSVADQLTEAIQVGERIPGVGRPALGHDERNAQVVELVRRYDVDRGKSWGLALEVDAFFARTKGQRINSAGLQGAVMRDMGFSPHAASAFCTLYFMVTLLSNATFALEQKR